MSIVPGRDVPQAPEAWIDAVNKRINDENHLDLCGCRAWPETCQYYRPGQWDEDTVLHIAVAVLEPLIRERFIAESRKPSVATVTRRLAEAGHTQSPAGAMGKPGFRVALNKAITPDGVAVLRQGGPDGAEQALESYAQTLRKVGYDAQVVDLIDGLRGVYVKRPPKGGAR